MAITTELYTAITTDTTLTEAIIGLGIYLPRSIAKGKLEK